ncbi:hypothetical protein ACFLUV_02570 [Elusimicrobiota bacterium]
MKALFFCRTNRTKMMLHIAKYFKEMKCLDKAYAFVAYYDKWRDYLENQSEIDFDKITGTKELFRRMDEEQLQYEAIERIEKDYSSDIELWNLIFCEPMIVLHTHHKYYNQPAFKSREEYLKFVQVTFHFFEELFDEIKPDMVIDFARISILRGIINLVARKRNIPFMYPTHALVKDRYYICRDIWEEYKPIVDAYHKLLTEKAQCPDGYDYLKWFRESGEKSIYYHRLRPDEKKKISMKDIKKTVALALRIPKEINLRFRARKDPVIRYNFQLFKGLPSVKGYRDLMAGFRKLLLKIKPPFKNIADNKNYVLLTLHVQPEASTSVLSPYFVNQRAVIDGISRSLPLGWELVIKPNHSMVGIEPISFYSWINSIPNACLVSPHADIKKLIENSKMVIAITGTSGFEAALKGKKVIIMSNKPIWSMIRGIVLCTDFTKLHRIINEEKNKNIDDYDLAAYLQAVHDNSFSLKENYIWKGTYDLSDPDYKEAINIIAQKIYEAYRQEK